VASGSENLEMSEPEDPVRGIAEILDLAVEVERADRGGQPKRGLEDAAQRRVPKDAQPRRRIRQVARGKLRQFPSRRQRKAQVFILFPDGRSNSCRSNRARIRSAKPGDRVRGGSDLPKPNASAKAR
jgi:hypothetical protein